MTMKISERTRAVVAETLPLMERNRAALEEALERYMTSHGPYEPAEGRNKALTWAMTDMLLGHARQLAAGKASDLSETAERHRVLAIRGELYPSFGDALHPVMRDVLGAEASAGVLAAWGDAYWAIVRALDGEEVRLAA